MNVHLVFPFAALKITKIINGTKMVVLWSLTIKVIFCDAKVLKKIHVA